MMACSRLFGKRIVPILMNETTPSEEHSLHREWGSSDVVLSGNKVYFPMSKAVRL